MSSPMKATASTSVELAPVEACERYFAAALACRPKLSEVEQRLVDVSVAQYRKQLRLAVQPTGRTALAIGCEAERDALLEDERCR